MEYILVPAVALLASILTFFSGFGLGTILLPTFLLFYPPEIAVALTAIVHLLNNLFKLALIGKSIHYKTLLKFGIPALIGAFIGAEILSYVANFETTVNTFILFGRKVNYINLIIGSLLIVFAFFELLPKLKNWQLPNNLLQFGGFLSGFFGGLSGHQGALRAAFLVKVGLEKTAFIATGVAIAVIVDLVRITIYAFNFKGSFADLNFKILAISVLAAFLGAYFGKKLLQKTTISIIQTVIGLLMILMGVLMILGIIS
jgi:uncharacterized protein